MGKNSTDGITDGTLDKYAECVFLDVCSAEPLNFAEIATYTLARVALTGGDYTKAAGTPDGRQVTVSAKADFAITSAGTATHVVISKASVDFGVTTCSPTVLGSGTVSTGQYTITIRKAA